LPAGASCSFSPNSITGNPQQLVTTTLMISTTSTAALQPDLLRWIPVTSLAAVFGVWGFRRRRPFALILIAVGSALSLASLSACGGGGGSGAGGGGGTQPPVTSTITITGSSGSLQNSATLSLTVTP
jgi:hypothetical protein